jgi:hypothetical protein
MKAVCTGQMTKARVVSETIEQYRGVYARMQQHPDVLRTVRTKSRRTYFSADVIVGCSEVCFRGSELRIVYQLLRISTYHPVVG